MNTLDICSSLSFSGVGVMPRGEFIMFRPQFNYEFCVSLYNGEPSEYCYSVDYWDMYE